ncbi:MAG: DUF2061 domain-containing protein [Alphaproteobacteria bacterium]|nr:DUF2061 domain-containing protein [Alphaproteobacteria bacterium]
MRTVVKTGTYGVMHFVVAVAVAFALTGDWRVALAVGLVEPVVQTVAYALHDRAFARWWPERPATVGAATGDHRQAALPSGAAPV